MVNKASFKITKKFFDKSWEMINIYCESQCKFCPLKDKCSLLNENLESTCECPLYRYLAYLQCRIGTHGELYPNDSSLKRSFKEELNEYLDKENWEWIRGV